MCKYRIKEYTNKHGVRKFQVQVKRFSWLFGGWWKDYKPWYNTTFYSIHEARNCLIWMSHNEEQEIRNRAKKTEYHYHE